MIPRPENQGVTLAAWSVRMMLLAVYGLLAFMSAVSLADAQTIPKDGIAYLTGGIGFDEMEQLKSREHEFNLKLVFTLVEGNYLSDVSVVVKDKAGTPVLVLFAPGPVVLAKLPRGSYVVATTYEDNTQTRRFDVRERMRTEYVRWPSNPETDFPGPKATERE